MSGKGKGGRGKKAGKSTSRSAKAGLQFPVGRVARYMRNQRIAKRMGSGAHAHVLSLCLFLCCAVCACVCACVCVCVCMCVCEYVYVQ